MVDRGDTYETLLYKNLASVATITLNRPHVRNAIDGVLRTELLHALLKADGDDSVRVIVLTGSGSAFCSGADLKALADARAAGRDSIPPKFMSGIGLGSERNLARTPHGVWNLIVEAMKNAGKPIIASVNGPAVGGGLGLCCAADIRIASDSATFCAIFAERGLAPEIATSFYLPRLIGQERAMRLIFTADTIDADTALRWGLVSEVVPSVDLDERGGSTRVTDSEPPPASHQLGTQRAMACDGGG